MRDRQVKIVVAVLQSLFTVVKNQPIIGVFVGVLQLGLDSCERVLVCRQASRDFSGRLEEVAIVLHSYFKCNEVGCDLSSEVRQLITDMAAIVEEATEYIDKFTKGGAFQQIFVGALSINRFGLYDSMIQSKLSALVTVLSLSHAVAQQRSFEAILNIQSMLHDKGGLQGLLSDVSRLNDVAVALGE